MRVMIESDEQKRPTDAKNGQMWIPDLPAACVDSDGGRSLPTAAVQYPEEQKESILNSGSLPCPGFTGLPWL